MEYRVEKKYLCTDAQLAILESRLLPLMAKDAHQQGNAYLIRSLYFDTLDDAFMNGNDAGVDQREKYRVRIYDLGENPMHLEIKEKFRGYCHKSHCAIDRNALQEMISGLLPAITEQMHPVMRRFWLKAAQCMMRPALIVQYERSAFVSPLGNVRITFDRNIAVSDAVEEFFSPATPMLPVLPGGRHILEVKYDEFLPEYIAQALELGNLQQTTFSKYYIGRLAIGH